jgi:hypothetical protein
LTFRGGLILSSEMENFGGWSGLEVSPDGRRMIAISDAGAWMSATIDYSGSAPRAVTAAHIGALKAKGGKPLSKDRDRDAEGLSLVSGTLSEGEAMISFENHHRVGRFPVKDGEIGAPRSYLKMPKDPLRKRRDGLEAMSILRGGPHRGSVIAFSEHALGEDALHAGWIWLNAEPKRLSIRNSDEYALTDAVSLDDGSLIVLERRFRVFDGVRMRLRRFAAETLVPGAVLTGDVLMEADMNHEIDNMEGLAVHRATDGATVLTIISDDNFNRVLQRTVLLQFTLDRGAGTSRAPG